MLPPTPHVWNAPPHETTGDLKPALGRAINLILQPVRDHFANNAEAKELLKKVRASAAVGLACRALKGVGGCAPGCCSASVERRGSGGGVVGPLPWQGLICVKLGVYHQCSSLRRPSPGPLLQGDQVALRAAAQLRRLGTRAMMSLCFWPALVFG